MAYDEELAGRLRDICVGVPGISEKKMFGGLAFLVNGNMAVAAASKGGLLLRIPPDRTGELLGEQHTDEFHMQGRSTAGWLRVTPDGVTEDDELERWATIGLDYAASLPRK